MQLNRKKTWLIIAGLVVLAAIVLALPPVWSRVTYYSREAYTTVKYWLKPPSEAVFVPSAEEEDGFVATSVAATLTAYAPTPQPTLSGTATPTSTTPEPTPAPTITPTPLPASVYLPGVISEPQLWNNCGPATISMYLSFYKWGLTQNEAADVLKPNPRDKNVMPYEMVNYVNYYTAQRALWRYGGDLQTIKALLAAGFPVMVETGFEPANLRKEGWMGHYLLLIGYDDTRQSFNTQDSYLLSHPPGGGEAIPEEWWNDFKGFEVPYSELEHAWRAFNYVYIVVYPPDKENDVLNTLGVNTTDEMSNHTAYNRAINEATSLSEVRDRYFAWFNAGTSLVNLGDFVTAASAYDTAFGLYPEIPEDFRPYRMMWYQTGPYYAYYYAGRYDDVIILADQTLKNMSEPILEESYYWRAMAYYALGDKEKAVADLRESLKHHPGFGPSVSMLQQIGETP